MIEMKTAVVITVMVFAWVFGLMIGAVSADDSGTSPIKYNLNVLIRSHHFNPEETGVTNEQHNGVGISATLPNGATYGFMRYKNSYGDMSNLMSISGEIPECPAGFCFGAGVGFVTGYGEHLAAPFLGWGSIRKDWFVVTVIPTELVAIGLSIPLEDLI